MDDEFRKKDREEVLKALNKHFKTVAAEKYPTAVLEFYFTEAIKELVGNKPFRSISERKRKKIVERVLQKLRVHYGKYINILSFDKKGRYLTNFDYVFKTEYGRLYGYEPFTGMRHTFLTSHCLERFEERIPQEAARDFNLVFRKTFGVEPTAADFLKYLMMVATEMGIDDHVMYINFIQGIAVVDPLPSRIFIVKTILTPKMLNDKVQWFYFINDGEKRVPIKRPHFDKSRFTYEYYNGLIHCMS